MKDYMHISPKTMIIWPESKHIWLFKVLSIKYLGWGLWKLCVSVRRISPVQFKIHVVQCVQCNAYYVFCAKRLSVRYEVHFDTTPHSLSCYNYGCCHLGWFHHDCCITVLKITLNHSCFVLCFSNPNTTDDDTALHMSCLGTYGGPIDPTAALQGYPGKELLAKHTARCIHVWSDCMASACLFVCVCVCVCVCVSVCKCVCL